MWGQRRWQPQAGMLLLRAAAHQTGVMAAFGTAITSCVAKAAPRLAHSRSQTRHNLVGTLLFLGAAGLRRTWDIRAYSGQGLAVVTGRAAALGYSHTERFLAQVAQANTDKPLTAALARWTTALWPCSDATPLVYIDGHHKPVYANRRIPRGLVGRLGKILGCRGLVLLHDREGHPLLATTARGDQHLTLGLPAILARYTQATGTAATQRVVVDREGMAAALLQSLCQQGQTVVTILRSNQYTGIGSFTDVGAFTPVTSDKNGRVLRDVAPARFQLRVPDHPDQTLPLHVALLRDWRSVRRETVAEKAGLSEPRLIPLVTTAADASAPEIVETYTKRWPCQENVIKDWLLPVGLDTNHGYDKTVVENSEIATRRQKYEEQLANCRRFRHKADDAVKKLRHKYDALHKRVYAYQDTLNRSLTQHQFALEDTGLPSRAVTVALRECATIERAHMAQLQEARDRLWERLTHADQLVQQYQTREARVTAALTVLDTKNRVMAELDDRKDQIMTVCKVALANLGMWLRTSYFPSSYARVTWRRLLPFFHLDGWVTDDPDRVCVEVQPFRDRRLAADLAALCARVAVTPLYLPDGRRLHLTVHAAARPVLLAHLS